MKSRTRTLFVCALFTLMALLSALHCHLFGPGLDYDINAELIITSIVNFLLAFQVNRKHHKWLLVGYLMFMPLLSALSFSWAELVLGLNPAKEAMVWGVMWFVTAYVTSWFGFILGLGCTWFAVKFL
jgi:hypothetical protein